MNKIYYYLKIYIYLKFHFFQSILIGSSQSTIELVKHLHNLLSDEEKIAKEAEVIRLSSRYDELLKIARSREQQMREMK